MPHQSQHLAIADQHSVPSQNISLGYTPHPIHLFWLPQARITGRLRPLLEHLEGEVRARACNVVGNLCRYNFTFYEPFLEAGLIEVIIDRCQDYDRGARKFATFAIGNAGKALHLRLIMASFVVRANICVESVRSADRKAMHSVCFHEACCTGLMAPGRLGSFSTLLDT